LLPQIFKATASCDQANVTLADVPFAVWSAMLFGLLALLSLMALQRAAPRRLYQ
jgi:disulfide bond formation protein DsbB